MATQKRPNDPPRLPTDAELDILAALWELGPSTVREVHELVGRRKPTVYTTVLKQMQIMADKGLLTRSERFRTHVYEPRAPKEETQRQLAAHLLARAFGGSAKHLVLGALSAEPISAKEAAEIRRLLKRYEEEHK